ncbi:MAG: hypothetical protein LBT00_10055 [Spirochaetaceae bacterium]|nr:hypothetical protein [Spirochaetaceae bacterium]
MANYHAFSLAPDPAKVFPTPFQPGGGCPKRAGTVFSHNICAKIVFPNTFFPFFLAVRRIYPCFPAPVRWKRPGIRFFFVFSRRRGQTSPKAIADRWPAIVGRCPAVFGRGIGAFCSTTFAR